MTPTPIPPTEPLSATLQAQQWNQVLALLSDVPAPHRITDPLIRALADQLVRQQEQRTTFEDAQALDEDNVVPLGAD
jgi:hypothetical protein